MSVHVLGTSTVIVPVGGQVFQAGAASLAGGSVTIDGLVPNDPSLVGSKICWCAVVLDHVTGRVLYMARTGGPIIEDAIC